MKVKIERKATVDEILFYIAWSIFIISLIAKSAVVFLNVQSAELVFKLIRYVAYAICGIKILRMESQNWKIIMAIMVVLTFVLSYTGSRNMTMPLYSLIIIAAMGIEDKKIITNTVWVQSVLLIAIVGLSQVGIIEDYIFDPEGRARHGLGFDWTTTSAILFLYITCGILYVRKNRVTIIEIVVLEAINYWLYKMTDSRMSFAILTLTLMFWALQKIVKMDLSFIGKFKYLPIVYPFILEILSIVVFSNYDAGNPTWVKFNDILSDRLELSKSAIDTYGFSLFGKEIEWIGYSIDRPNKSAAIGYNYVDSSYLQLTLVYGIIFIIVVLSIYAYAMYKCIKAKEYYAVILYVVILTFSLTEPRLMNFAYNPFALLAFSNIVEESSRKKDINRKHFMFK